jgi:hypothetical protein
MKDIQNRQRNYSSGFKVSVLLLLSGIVISIYLSVYFLGGSDKSSDAVRLKYSAEINTPGCSVNSGFYSTSLTVSLSATPGLIIYYTLDGSAPDLNSEVYEHPLLIDNKSIMTESLSMIPTSPRWKPPLEEPYKANVIRAIAVDGKNRKSGELVRTFFTGGKEYSFPVIELTVNVKDFFGYKNGIYVLGKSYGDKDNYIRKNIPLNLPWWEYPSNYLMRGMDSEREAHLEFFEPEGHPGFTANAGVRINGNATRGYAQKSLRISFRKKYGAGQLKYDLFSEGKERIYNSFILRNSGNDWDKTMFRDGLMQSLMKDAHVEIQKDRPSIVFINGEYWGIHNIRERFDENYLVNKYDLPADSIVILELNGNVSYGKKSDRQEFMNLLDFIKTNDLFDAKNYEYVCSRIDIESFTDFLIANIYFCNSDWPNNNVKFWHYRTVSHVRDSVRDGRWRWMLYDMDWGFGYNSMSTPETNLLPKAKATGSVGVLFSGLIKNEQFRAQFLSRYRQLMNTVYSPDYLLTKIDSVQNLMAPEISDHIKRWRVIGTYNDWLDNIEVLKKFARERRKFQSEQLNAFFNLKPEERISLK